MKTKFYNNLDCFGGDWKRGGEEQIRADMVMFRGGEERRGEERRGPCVVMMLCNSVRCAPA